MESTESLARLWIESWNRMDLQTLRRHLAEEFFHVSPFGRLDGREHYLEVVEPMARKSVAELVVRHVVAQGDRAAIWFENRTRRGVVDSCDWVHTEGEIILSVHSFYDPARVQEILSPAEQDGLGD